MNTLNPDPLQSLNDWTRENFPKLTVIGDDTIFSVWQLADVSPAVYWRPVIVDGYEQRSFLKALTITLPLPQQNYTLNWSSEQFIAHVIADSVTGRNQWLKALLELIQLEGKIMLTDGSPMLITKIAICPNADPLRQGQLLLTGRYMASVKQCQEEAEEWVNYCANMSNYRGDTNANTINL